MVKPQPTDCCLLNVNPKLIMDTRLKALKWSDLIAQSRFAPIKNVAMDVFTAVGHSHCDIPYVWLHNAGLILMWSEGERFLYVKILPGEPVSFQITREFAIPDRWQVIANRETTEEVLFKMGRYIAGTQESDCGTARRQAG